jgi:protein involved in polysaccharide export with SLBB domain
VKRPGVFELPADRHPILLDEAMALAGGPILPGPTRSVRFTISVEGSEVPDELGDGAGQSLSDGDLLLVSPVHDVRVGSVSVTGHVRHPGPRALAEVETLTGLLAGADLLPEPYIQFAVLESADPESLARVMVPIDLQAVLDRRADRVLSPDDVLIVLGAADVSFLTSTSVLKLLRTGGRAQSEADCAGVSVLARSIAADRQGILADSPLARAAVDLVPAAMRCPRIFNAYPDLLAFALKHAVLLRSGVTRPGLYPVAGQSDVASLARTAGGGSEKLAVVDGAGLNRQKGDQPAGAARRGDIVDATTPRFELVGHVRYPGTRTLAGAGTLRQVLGDGSQNLPGLYPLFGVIERQDRSRMTSRLIAFSPHEVISGASDRPLADGDHVRLFAASEIRSFMKFEWEPGSSEPGPRKLNPGEPSAGEPGAGPADSAGAALRTLMVEQGVVIHGSVRQPGTYPVDGLVRLEMLLATAGGLTAQADSDAIEITSPAQSSDPGTVSNARRMVSLHAANGMTAELGPGEAVRVNPIFHDREPYAVLVQGEVKRPGSFEVIRGERLSSLLARAGGLTQEAYPAGAIFTRETVRRQQAEAFTSAARNLDRELAMVLMKPDPPPAAQIAQARELSGELRKVQPVGRITVEADPAMLVIHPELDVVLEPGDRIFFPKRSLTVTVAGEVLAPASLQFAPGKASDQYLVEAGGMTQYADSSRVFVLRPDGSAQPLRVSFWNHGNTPIAPGSTIIVPRDPEPFQFFKFAQNIGALFSQAAVTAAAIMVLGDR